MYTVKLQEFEGPLDLLLFFIKRDELDIYNIPIARIAKEFMDYIHYIESLDLEVAGEFLVITAELMQIKVKMLLPPEPGDQEEEDPRANLVKRLIEYKRFKEIAAEMSKREEEESKVFYRGYYGADPRAIVDIEEQDSMREVSLFDLISSLKFAIEQMPKMLVHEIERLNVTIDEQIDYLLDYFSRRSEGTFDELVKDMREKIRIIVTFLALLELVRAKRLIVRQVGPFAELAVVRSVG